MFSLKYCILYVSGAEWKSPRYSTALPSAAPVDSVHLSGCRDRLCLVVVCPFQLDATAFFLPVEVYRMRAAGRNHQADRLGPVDGGFNRDEE